jgi:hypothetical protein
MLLPALLAYADVTTGNQPQQAQPAVKNGSLPTRFALLLYTEVAIFISWLVLFYDVVTLPELVREVVAKYEAFIFPIYEIFPGGIFRWLGLEFTELWKNVFTAFLITSTAANIDAIRRSNKTFYAEYTEAFIRQQVRMITSEKHGKIPLGEWIKMLASAKYKRFWGYYYDFTKIVFTSVIIFLVGQKFSTAVSLPLSVGLGLFWFALYLFYQFIYFPVFWNLFFLPMRYGLPKGLANFGRWRENMRSKSLSRIVLGALMPFFWLALVAFIIFIISVVLIGLLIDLVIAVPSFFFSLIAMPARAWKTVLRSGAAFWILIGLNELMTVA